METITPINDQIAFEFLDDTTKGKFNEKSGGGILLVQHAHKQVDYCRWARVKVIGPDVKNVSVGDIVLIQNLRWSNQFMIGEDKYWLTAENEIIATWDDPNNLPSEVA